jgi:N-acyl-D-aspartate/D-glutamate deacylase
VTIRGQVYPRPVGLLFGLDLSFHPFSLHPSFRPLADLPLADKVAALRDPALRARLLAEAPADSNPFYLAIVEASTATYVMGDPPVYDPAPEDRLDRIAAREGRTAAEVAYDRLLDNDGRNILFLPGANYRDGNLNAAREMCTHPDTIIGLGDGGAHYGVICDASFTTFYLQHFVRDAAPAQAVPLPAAIRSLTDTPARAVGLNDRGRLAPGYLADINVIDLAALTLHAPTMARDLPAGGKRLRQLADGYAVTIKSGVITYRDGEPSGALPGRLVRGAQAVA